MAHSVECLTLEFGSGGDLRVVQLSPSFGLVLGVEPAVGVSLPLPCPPFSLSINKQIKQITGESWKGRDMEGQTRAQ